MSRLIHYGLILTTFSILCRSCQAGEVRDTKNHTENVRKPKLPNYWDPPIPAHHKIPLNAIDVAIIRRDVVDKINYYRKHHELKPLSVKYYLQQYAQEWANDTLLYKDFAIPYNPNNYHYGENVAFFTGLKHVGEVAVDLWYYTLRYYEGPDTIGMDIKEVIDLLSSKSEFIGVGVSGYRGGRVNIVANYYPRGYRRGQYEENIPENIKAEDVTESAKRWKNIEDSLNPTPGKKPKKYVSSEFPNGELPGWESILYAKGVNRSLLDSRADHYPNIYTVK